MKVKAEFKTVISKTEKGLDELINKHLNDGWILDGGVSIDYNADAYGNKQSYVYYQHLMRKKKKQSLK